MVLVTQKSQIAISGMAGLPEIGEGMNLAELIADQAAALGTPMIPGDIIVIAQKILSKAEGRRVPLSSVTPDARAEALAAQTGKDARLVALILAESSAIVRAVPGVLITRHRLGFVAANAGIDQSNVPDGDDHALLLPLDPDTSARALASAFSARAGGPVAVIISDSFGRAWRIGTAAVAIGCAGIAPVHDQRGSTDRFGRVLKVTQPAVADQLAAAAALVMGEADEGVPAALIRGYHLTGDGPASELIRPEAEDLFG